jgi:hypothetical protein
MAAAIASATGGLRMEERGEGKKRTDFFDFAVGEGNGIYGSLW